MLDQNTDRSWWMIAAIVLGALLVGIMVKTNPEVFQALTGFSKDRIPTAQITTDYGAYCHLGHCVDSDLKTVEKNGENKYTLYYESDSGKTTSIHIVMYEGSYSAEIYTNTGTHIWPKTYSGDFVPPTLETITEVIMK